MFYRKQDTFKQFLEKQMSNLLSICIVVQHFAFGWRHELSAVFAGMLSGKIGCICFSVHNASAHNEHFNFHNISI